MAKMNWLTNEGSESATVVKAPAFSITKITGLGAPVVAAIASLIVANVENLSFDEWQIVALVGGFFLFLAIIVAADVIARGIATAAAQTATGRDSWVRFDTPIRAVLRGDATAQLTVLAACSTEPPEYLCLREDHAIEWIEAAKVTLRPAG